MTVGMFSKGGAGVPPAPPPPPPPISAAPAQPAQPATPATPGKGMTPAGAKIQNDLTNAVGGLFFMKPNQPGQPGPAPDAKP